MIKPRTVEEQGKRVFMKVPEGEITVDDLHWQLAQIAYDVEVGAAGSPHLSPRKRLQELARATGISFRKLQEFAETWRCWAVEFPEEMAKEEKSSARDR